MDLRLVQAQAVVFVAAIQKSRMLIATTASMAVPALGEMDPIILPIPDESPPEVPRIIIQNPERGRTFHFSPSRIDLFAAYPDNPSADQLNTTLAPFLDEVAALWRALSEQASALGSRIALVTNLTVDTQNAVTLLSKEYIAAEYARNSAEAQVHFLHKLSLGDFHVNRWVRLTTQEKNPRALNVLIDVNTIADEALEVTPDIILAFLGRATSLIQETIAAQARVEQ